MSVTLDSILEWFKDAIENERIIRPAEWLEKAMQLNILVEDLDIQLAKMKAAMADKKVEFIEKGMTAAKADILKIKAVNYEEYLQLEAKRKRIDEHIMIAKKRENVREF